MTGLALDKVTVRKVVRAQERLLDCTAYSDVDAWRRSVTYGVRDALDADKAAFLFPGLDDIEPLFAEGYDNDTPRKYVALFGDDQWIRTGHSRAARLRVASREDLFPGQLREFRRSRYYNEVCRTSGAHDSLQATVAVPGAGVPAALYVHHHSRHGPRFGPRGEALIRLIRPALVAAVHAVGRWGRVQVELDRVGDPIVLIAAGGSCVYRNEAARAFFTPRNEVPLMRAAIAVAAACPGTVSRDGGAHRGPVLSPSTVVPFEGQTYHMFATLRDTELGPERMVAVTIVTPGTDHAALQAAREIARLTSRQVEVADALARRMTNAEIASWLGISEHTARHHTEAVMEKLSVHSRQDVAAALRALAGPTAER